MKLNFRRVAVGSLAWGTGAALFVLGGCSSGAGVACGPEKPVIYHQRTTMPLAVGDDLGVAVFTTRSALQARGIGPDATYAQVPSE
jgi:hypothetical protein